MPYTYTRERYEQHFILRYGKKPKPGTTELDQYIDWCKGTGYHAFRIVVADKDSGRKYSHVVYDGNAAAIRGIA